MISLLPPWISYVNLNEIYQESESSAKPGAAGFWPIFKGYMGDWSKPTYNVSQQSSQVALKTAITFSRVKVSRSFGWDKTYLGNNSHFWQLPWSVQSASSSWQKLHPVFRGFWLPSGKRRRSSFKSKCHLSYCHWDEMGWASLRSFKLFRKGQKYIFAIFFKGHVYRDQKYI